MQWEGWPLERWCFLFISIAYLMIGIQVTLYHYRQSFHNKAMWTPVILTPIIFVSGIVHVLNRTDASVTVFIWLMAIAIANGLIGFYFHVRGMPKRVGGVTLRNFTIGPPFMLPLMLSALGAFGLIVIYH